MSLNKLLLGVAALSAVALTSCGGKKGQLQKYQIERPALDVFKYRDTVKDSLQFVIEGVTEAQVKEPVEKYGKIDIFNLKDVKEEDDNGQVIYVSTYDVEYANAVGTETFKIKSIKKRPKVVGYSYDLKDKAPVADTTVMAQ
ncbi:hypothetical protein [Faecalibacter rhinopitheci]|uniref:Lipoprotein n=1 Tax=Faecalibacter rhinopitheci TaxID=2779678 RepID=A0A8J7FQQ7_9FLAO|nr:hypothetical protein [Faecalibacter rhinopitheci]MBF0597789.1 hypothetical protein [Faecalibacter rhinopitheci]MBQ0147811.1 hypothetical protein [Candidatus Onthonaster equi]